MHYQQWLQSFAPMSLFTNEEILNGSPMPDGWFNPYTISQEQIDNMRESFKGSGLSWQRHCEEYLPHLDSKAERKLKVASKKLESYHLCGKVITWIGKDGLPCTHIHNCNRYDICLRCRMRREKEHVSRLRELDGCRYVFDEENVTAKYGKENVYNFTLADGRKVSIIKTDDNIGCELSHESIKELKSIVVTGTRTSGNLGNKPDKEEVKEQRTVMVTSHIIEALDEVKKAIKLEYYELTKNFTPKTLDELVSYLKQCNAIWLDIVNRCCDKNHIVGKKMLVLTEDDIDWSERQSFIEKELNASIRQTVPS